MSQQQKNNLILGSLLIFAGIVVLLSKLEFLPPVVFHIFISWPMLLIAIGVLSRVRGQKRTGDLLIIVGIIFLIPRTGLIPAWSIDKYWPVILIAVGLFLLYKHFSRNQEEGVSIPPLHEKGNFEGEFIQESAFFGGSEKSIISKNLKGGRVQCMFGGIEMNMTHAELEGSQAILDVYIVFGGVEIIVPPTWVVKAETTPILGGFSDKRYTRPNENAPTLIIRGTIIFGGCEVKSYI